ncbi:uncharacterized protein BX663DRAFT_491648 [Cokeromyces recurvatus]|uniref:uncharacterized protein n=1 Tax=Cokeromyces recurvatus TaxID=90255 RepID=UPI00222016BE|nr:uncharacterized protein BX663DRAFT_491648 [Cokeromyces recurvatus]KAI7907670.1 hypothetical protein BX663DRAFT_491648 [Cokeromyces recurvatus]
MSKRQTSFVTLLLFSIILIYHSSLIIAYAISNLSERLSNRHIDPNTIGCKCIMTVSTLQHTDSAMCMCFNRSDGTLDNTNTCTTYTDTVFRFCTDVASTGSWQRCVKHYCPCDEDKESLVPSNKVNF